MNKEQYPEFSNIGYHMEKIQETTYDIKMRRTNYRLLSKINLEKLREIDIELAVKAETLLDVYGEELGDKS